MSILHVPVTATNIVDWVRKAATSLNLLITGKQDRSGKLDDVAALDYTGNAAYVIAVNATEDGLELVAQSGGGSGVADGDYGDIVVSSGGTAINFDSSVVTAFAKTFLDDADAASVRTTIGAQASGSYLVTTNNLSDVSNAATARTNLGLAIGTNVQAYDATLTSLAAYNSNGIVCQTAADTFAGRTLTGPAAGITVSNGDGVSGNPTLALANDLAALEALSGTNTIYYRSAADTWSAVTIGGGLGFSSGTLSASMVFVGRTAFSAASNVDIALSDTYDSFYIEFYLVAGTDNVAINAGLTSNNFSSILAGATDYTYNQFRHTSTTGVSNSNGTTNINLLTTALGNAADEFLIGTITVSNAKEASPTHIAFDGTYATTTTTYAGVRTIAAYKPTTSINGIRISASSGTVTGYYKVWGRKAS